MLLLLLMLITDLMLLAPCVTARRRLVSVCDSLASEFYVWFNAKSLNVYSFDQ